MSCSFLPTQSNMPCGLIISAQHFMVRKRFSSEYKPEITIKKQQMSKIFTVKIMFGEPTVPDRVETNDYQNVSNKVRCS